MSDPSDSGVAPLPGTQPGVEQQVAPQQWPPQAGVQDMSLEEYERQTYPEPYAQPQPQPSKRKRTGLIVGLVSGGALLFLMIVAGIIGAVALSTSHSPEHPVAAYLRALGSGNASEALRLSGVHATSADLLLTDAAYRASTDHISAFTIGTTTTDGDTATVTARLTQGAQHYEQTFTLQKTGTDLLFFPTWQLQPVQLGAVLLRVNGPSDAALTVAGIAAPAGATVQLVALPGTYPIAATTASKWYTLNDASATVIGFGTAGSRPVTVTATLTQQGLAAATDAVNNYLDGCAAAATFMPPNCPFGATGQDPAYTYSNEKWTIDPRPTIEIGAWRSGGWSVTTTTPGAATFTADVSNATGHGTSSTDPIPVRVAGSITKIDDSGATFSTTVVEPATA